MGQGRFILGKESFVFFNLFMKATLLFTAYVPTDKISFP